MKLFMSDDVPEFAQKELDELKQRVAPLVKKSSIYMVISMFLLMISLTNLTYLILYPFHEQSFMMIVGLALCGAFGMALVKETRFFHIEIERLGNQFIIDRINESEYLTEVRKKEYIRWIQDQPFIAIKTFIDFLSEEDMKKKRFYEQ
ncbi:DUF5392 family protein [Bacillus sp. PS06]|uniref:DUF5392 family protein n=1 Tax=Bacillus sp. PS06 TaxID=2764176 RepID=UPI00178546FA|nr:DUF5392 family protein [Bacillus sp. PS06]MBD8069074.1 DUF5392 family protein [Bacillus sp. PS06]